MFFVKKAVIMHVFFFFFLINTIFALKLTDASLNGAVK